MEQPEPWNSEHQRGEVPPPPLGAIYENPPNILERLRNLNQTDPAFVSWVLVRAEEIMTILGETDNDNTKEMLIQSFIEAYDIHEARLARDHIQNLFEAG